MSTGSSSSRGSRPGAVAGSSAALQRARSLHLSAASELARCAEAISEARWHEPREEGKWSPAEILEHLNRTYDTLLRELRGGEGMRVRTRAWQRWLLRRFLVPKLLRGRPFPRGARAPWETRPGEARGDRAAAIAGFRERAAEIDAELDRIPGQSPSARLTHAYFGRASVEEGILLCARHIEHHRRQLEPLGSGPGIPAQVS